MGIQVPKIQEACGLILKHKREKQDISKNLLEMFRNTESLVVLYL